MKQFRLSSILICIFLLSFGATSNADDWRDYYSKDENRAILSTGGRVRRIDDKNLSLTLNTGKKIILTDQIAHPDDDEQVRYNFREINSTLGVYLVDILYWEDAEILMVEMNDGTSNKIPNIPIINPSKSKFICVSDNLIEGVAKIHIYGINNSKFEKEFDYTPNNHGAENPKWLNDSEVTIDLYKFGRDAKGKEIKNIVTIHLFYIANKWKMRTLVPNKNTIGTVRALDHGTHHK
jgi:hypothetical protein